MGYMMPNVWYNQTKQHSEGRGMETTKSFTIKSLTKRHLPFYIGWVIMFIWLYAYFLPFGGFRFESNLYNGKVTYNLLFTFIWLVTGAVTGLLINGKNFSRLSFYSVLTAIAGFISVRFAPAGLVSDLIMAVSSAAIGYLFASYCYAFFMVLNNAEKFYAMLLAVFTPKLFLLLKPLLNVPEAKIDGASIVIFIFLLILLCCAFFGIKKKDTLETAEKEGAKPPAKAYTVMLPVFAVLTLNDVIAPAVINNIHEKLDIGFEPYYFAGIVLGMLIIAVFQIILKNELYYLLNLSFACAALGFVSGALCILNPFFAYAAFVFFGLSYAVGFVNIYYLAGFMAKKFRSIVFYRAGIALSSVFYLSAIFVTQLFERLTGSFEGLIAFSAFFSVLILIAFLLSTPFFLKNLSSREWMDDTYRVDITHGTRLGAKLKDYNLSPRETETCEKLLEGYTLRQIGGMMGISFSTVNTYCTSIYKKLSINSRTELLLMFREYQNNDPSF